MRKIGGFSPAPPIGGRRLPPNPLPEGSFRLVPLRGMGFESVTTEKRRAAYNTMFQSPCGEWGLKDQGGCVDDAIQH
jgi:hypothetical protein